MEKSKKYTLKIYLPGTARSVYRVLAISGNDTLEKLCTAILEAFDFSDEHLYEFCMDNKMYGEDSYYRCPEEGQRSADIALDQLHLAKGQNFSLHYDFGDDWMFTIHVQKIENVEGYAKPSVLKSMGYVCQYPDWDDEEGALGVTRKEPDDGADCDAVEQEIDGALEGEGINFEKIRQENDRYLEIFEQDLTAAGLKEKTIGRHWRNVEFYLNQFLLYYSGREMKDGLWAIDEYLGEFFIRRCMWSTPATIKSTAASIKKFYKSMADHEEIDQADYKELCEEIRDSMEVWQELCASYNDPDEINPFAFF